MEQCLKRKVLAPNQDMRTHPVMREELDLSWDDVKAEAEQRNVGQTVFPDRTFWKEVVMGEKKKDVC